MRSIRRDGKLAYTATAGTLAFFDQYGEHKRGGVLHRLCRQGAVQPTGPLTFVFNGGPGAASAFLHLGLVGPHILDFGRRPDGANAKLRDNPDSWLAFTDLVLIDPVGTGWSRAAKPDDAKHF